MKTRPTTAVLAAALIAVASTAWAAGPPKWITVEGVDDADVAQNDVPSFLCHVSVNHDNHIYHEGDTMVVTVQAEKDCYLYLLYEGKDGKGDTVQHVIFPNSHQTNNFIKANTPVHVPGEGSNFVFRTSAPFGQERLTAFVSLEPLSDEPTTLGTKSLTKNAVTQVTQNDLKQMVVEVKKQKQSAWTTHSINITTVGKGKPDPDYVTQHRRYGVCVGISQYEHDRIQDLQVSHIDAERMADAFRNQCGLDDVILLQNEQATRQAIEQAIYTQIEKSHPGDEVFIFFSCHGGRTSDTNGDEEDGFDEYLVPTDGILGKPETMILDDTFARWMQDLDGRKVAIFMDNCYSGGASKAIGGDEIAPKAATLPLGNKSVNFDGMEVEMARTKDIGQQNTIVIAACQANQLAWEMPPSQKGSVLTHYILEALKEDSGADKNQDGKLTVGETYQHVQQNVQQYVQDNFQAQQDPVYVDNAQDGIIFRQKN